ncbi:ribonuclease E inhibitor RraB [Alkanindiges illinoisensis]|uniref:ribonuclease E inhibitor RraB n=1 Tax=Alkanindiges illinoisensis TaxID=197183 RepID=UPI00047DA4B3|nr:ribonuclease E inhibitor RraB [Alkanindiges illinoisensis]
MTENPDAQVVAALKEAGSDISKPHQVEFVFDVAETSVDGLASALEVLELDICIYAPVPDNHTEQAFEVVAHKTMLLDVAELNHLSAQFEAIAAQHQASYNGWGAEIVD